MNLPGSPSPALHQQQEAQIFPTDISHKAPLQGHRFLDSVQWCPTTTAWPHLSLDYRVPLALFPVEQRWCHSGARSTVTQKGFNPWGIRVKVHKSHHFFFLGAEGFVCLEDSILESSWPHARHARGCTVTSVLLEGGQVLTHWIFWVQHHGLQHASHSVTTSGVWKTHLKAAGPQANKGSLHSSTSPFSLPACPVFDLSGNGCSLARFISEKCFNGSI